MNFSNENSRPAASAEIDRMSAAGKVILSITMAILRVSGVKLGAKISTTNSALSIRIITTTDTVAPMIAAMLKNNTGASRVDRFRLEKSGINTADIAPPMATSKIIVGKRVDNSNASAYPVVPNKDAITGSLKKPIILLSKLPEANKIAPKAIRRPSELIKILL